MTALDAYKQFDGKWENVASYMEHQAAKWLEEHTERIRLEERLKMSEAMNKPVSFPDWQSVNLGPGLPPNGETVLATDGKSVTEAKYYYYAGAFCKHGWYQIDGMALGRSWATHWMPMPTPPSMIVEAEEEKK